MHKSKLEEIRLIIRSNFIVVRLIMTACALFNIGLEDVMNFGWKLLRPISKLILKLLKFIHSLIPNYGIAIIILSIIIKICILPVNS